MLFGTPKHGLNVQTKLWLVPGIVLLLAIGAWLALGPGSASGAVPNPTSHWPAENNANDVVGGDNGTPQGGTTFGTGKFGLAFSLDGDGDWVEIPEDGSFNFAGDFTVEAWVNLDTFQDLSPIVTKYQNQGGHINNSFRLAVLNDGKARAYLACPSGDFFRTTTNAVVSTGQFTHIAGVYRQNPASLEIYVDGLLQPGTTSGTCAGGMNQNNTPLRFGRRIDSSGSGYLDGRIDEVKIYGFALSAQAVADAFGASPFLGLVSHFPGENNANDVEGGHNGILQGPMGFASGIIGQGFNYDGDTGYVSVSNDQALDITGNYTLEAFVRVDDVNTYRPIFIRGTQNSHDIEVYVQVGSNDLIVVHNRGNGGVGNAAGFQDPPIGQFFHLAVTYENGLVRAYYNGVEASVTQGPPQNVAPLDTNTGWSIGRLNHVAFGCECFFKGVLDEAKIYNIALTAAEIAAASDAEAPVLNLPAVPATEATSPAGAAVNFTVTTPDNLDPAPVVNCDATSGDTFPLGTTPVNCTATDFSGNQSPIGSFNVTVEDTIDPVLTLPTPPTAEATSSAGAVVDFVATATDIADSAPVVVCNPVSGSIFPLGVTQMDCTATDASANQSPIGSFDVTVEDTTDPVLTLRSLFTMVHLYELNASLDDSFGGPSLISDGGSLGATRYTFGPDQGLELNGGLVDTSSCSLAMVVEFDAMGSSGRKFIDFQDLAGNPGVYIRTDGLFFQSQPGFPGNTDLSTSGNIDLHVVLTRDASGNFTGYLNGNLEWSFNDSSNFAVPGSNILQFFERDLAAPGSPPLSGSVDCIAVYDGPLGDTDVSDLFSTGGCTKFVEATGPDGAVVDYSATATDIADPAPVLVCNPPSGSTFPIGLVGPSLTTQVNCTATDASGNQASGTFDVTVEDTTAPDLTVPPNAILEALAPGGIVHTFPEVATDIVDLAPVVVCTPPSGTTFEMGPTGDPLTTNVDCTATDFSGNQSAAGSFDVTVFDTKVATVNVKVDDLDADLVAHDANIDGDLAAHDTTIVGLVNTRATTIDNALSSLETKLGDETSFTDDSELAAHDLAVTSLVNTRATTIDNALSSLETKLDDETSFTDDSELAAHDLAVTSLVNTRADTQDAAVAALAGDVGTHDTNISNLISTRADTLDAAVAALSSDGGTHNTDISNLINTRADAVDAALVTLQAKADAIDTDLTAHDLAIDTLIKLRADTIDANLAAHDTDITTLIGDPSTAIAGDPLVLVAGFPIGWTDLTRNTLNKGSEGFSGGYWGSFAEILRPPGLFSQMCRPLISLRRGRCNL